MSEVTQFNRAPASSWAGFLNRKWKLLRFFLAKRAFESKLEGILGAAAGHEGNSLPAGHSQYQLLNTEAGSLCKEFAKRWDLDIELLKARIAGIAKVERLSVPTRTMNHAVLACFCLVAIPVFSFFMGAIAGLVNVGFHAVGGR